MAKKRKRLTHREYELIVDHIKPMLDGTIRNLTQLPLKDTVETGNYVRGQRLYYQHTLNALEWVMQIAKQRLEGSENV